MGRIKYCGRCGSPLTEDSKFCDNCGAAVPQEPGRDRDEQLFTPRRRAGNTASRAPRGRQAASEASENRENIRNARTDRPVPRDNRYPSGSSNYGASQGSPNRRSAGDPTYGISQGGPNRRPAGDPTYGVGQGSPNRRPTGDPTYGASQGSQSRRPTGEPNYGAPQGVQNRHPTGEPNYRVSQGGQTPRPPYRPQTGETLKENYGKGQASQRSRFRQEELENDWEQSWERETSQEEERRFTPAQWVLLGLMGVLVIALITFGIFWAVGRTKKSSEDRKNGAATEKRQEETVKNENGDDVITILDENGQPMASTQTEPQTQAPPVPAAETQPQTQAPTVQETQPPTEKQTEQPTEGQTETQPQTQPETQAIEILDGTQDQPAAPSGEYILADSSSRLLTEGDVAGLSYDDLQMAINEIYARHGRKFATPEIKAYFEGKSWYVGTVDADHFDETVFSDIENQNIQFLVEKMG